MFLHEINFHPAVGTPGGINEPIIQDNLPGDNYQPNEHGRR